MAIVVYEFPLEKSIQRAFFIIDKLTVYRFLATMAAFYGIELTKKGSVGSVTINWKQGSIIGIGGDHSQKYNIFNYETPHKSLVPLYVQHDYDSPDKIVCNERMQYGMNNGVFFVVLHDKS